MAVAEEDVGVAVVDGGVVEGEHEAGHGDGAVVAHEEGAFDGLGVLAAGHGEPLVAGALFFVVIGAGDVGGALEDGVCYSVGAEGFLEGLRAIGGGVLGLVGPGLDDWGAVVVIDDVEVHGDAELAHV